MAGKRDIAWVADQIVTTFQAYLPAKLTAFASEYLDPLTLTGVDNTNYHIAERKLIDGYPMVCVIPTRTDPAPLSGEANYYIEHHYLTVAIALTLNEGEDDLKRRTARTLRAIRSILKSYFTAGGTVVQLVCLREDFGPMMVGEESLLQEAQLGIRVTIAAAA